LHQQQGVAIDSGPLLQSQQSGQSPEAFCCFAGNGADFCAPGACMPTAKYVYPMTKCGESEASCKSCAAQGQWCPDGETQQPVQRPVQQPAQQPVQQPAMPATSASGSCSPVYQQCGGVQWSGPTCCDAGSTCDSHGDYYSQCTPDSNNLGGMQNIGAMRTMVDIMKKDDEGASLAGAATTGSGRRVAFLQALALFAAVPLLLAAVSVIRCRSRRSDAGFHRVPLAATSQLPQVPAATEIA